MKDESLKRMAALIGVLLLVAMVVTWSNYRQAGEADGVPVHAGPGVDALDGFTDAGFDPQGVRLYA